MLNYDDDPNYQQAIRQRVQQRLAPTDPMAPTAPPISSTPAPPAQSGNRNLNGYDGGEPRARTPLAGAQPLPDTRPEMLPFDIEQFGQGWVRSGGRTNQDFANYLAAHPLATGYSVTGNNKDRISGPNGYTRDAVYAAGLGGQGAQWFDPSRQGAGGASGAAPTTGASNPFLESIRAMLMQRLQADQQPVDANAPQIAEPYNAASLAAQRSQEGEKRDLSERLYAQGDLNSGALNQGIQQSAERNAVGLAGIRSQLIARAYDAKRADLNDAMQQALASGDAQMARQIQMELAQLNATVQREGYLNQKDIAEGYFNQNAVNAGANG